MFALLGISLIIVSNQFEKLHAKSDWVYLTTLIKYLKVKYIVSVVFSVLT
jgi:hypothetical protein